MTASTVHLQPAADAGTVRSGTRSLSFPVRNNCDKKSQSNLGTGCVAFSLYVTLSRPSPKMWPFPWVGELDPRPIHGTFVQSELLPQTASPSSQPFCRIYGRYRCKYKTNKICNAPIQPKKLASKARGATVTGSDRHTRWTTVRV